MTDSLNFGPAWIRNLSSDGNTGGSGGGTKYQLAMHRYGREEMLALFQKGVRAPESLPNFTSLYVEQSQLPLALIPLTEDENILWQSRSASTVASRGRGGSLERGRGRGRSATFHQGYSRSISSFDDPVRPYDRNQSGWAERNGGGNDGNDWSGAGSPRKETSSRSMGGSSVENWRRQRIDEDSDGWRATNHRPTEKWSRSGWREGDLSEERFERSIISDRSERPRAPWHSGGDTSHANRGTAPLYRRPWDGPIDDHLPEWATENLNEAGGSGSFDASGAFHGTSIIDDESNNCTNKTVDKSAMEDEKPHKADKNKIEKNKLDSINMTSNHEDELPRIASSKQPVNSLNLSQQNDENDRRKSEELKEIEGCKEKSNKIHEDVQKSPTKSSSKKIELDQVAETVSEASSKINNRMDDVTQPTINKPPNSLHDRNAKNFRNEEDLDRMKEVADDLVAKLMLDEESPNKVLNFSRMGSTTDQMPFNQIQSNPNLGTSMINSSLPSNVGHDQWFYRDPQGDLQGPFMSNDMTEWYRAGYFSTSLLLKRQCDERFFTLGELVKLCGGTGPFIGSIRIPPLKVIEQPGLPAPKKVIPPVGGMDPEALQFQQMHFQSLQQQMLYRQAMAIQALSQTEPWGGLSSLQQRELIAQHVLNQPQVIPESIHIMSSLAGPGVQTNNNPLMQMINQMQQANKLPPQNQQSVNISESKPITNMHQPQKILDPIETLIQQMGGMQQPLVAMSVPPPGSSQAPRGNSMTAAPIDQMQPPTPSDNDPIKLFLRQLSNQQQEQQRHLHQTQHMESFWNSGRFANSAQQSWINTTSSQNATNPTPTVWGESQTTNIPPRSEMLPLSTTLISSSENSLNNQLQEKEATTTSIKQEEHKRKVQDKKYEDEKRKQEKVEKERRKKEEQEKAKKDVEEKRKEEQRKETERKQQEEKLKKDAEKLKKEMEKSKREAEEKRAKELEEKRRLKEQRKLEEEAKRKAVEEEKRRIEEEKKKEQEKRIQEEQTRRQAEALKKIQETQQRARAPWCQAQLSNTAIAGSGVLNTNLSLAEIQKAEKERKAAELQQQQAKVQALKEFQEQQSAMEKSAMQLKWASKAALPKKVKSLAEIQAEEQERSAKQAAEARLAQQKEKKEATVVPSAGIWSSASQSLTWGQTTATGFWEDSTQTKVAAAVKATAVGVTKSSSAISISQISANKATTNQTKVNSVSGNNNKSKAKSAAGASKDESSNNELKFVDKNGLDLGNEFSCWCIKALTAINSDVDIPIFVGFLLDIESPYEVKDYVRTYLGEGNVASDFARQFLERRSKAKQRNRAAMQHTDDMCVPAPAVNPSNTTEFQEVKGKGKKVKKSRMMKVDSRCLGFSVTAAQDRINVGDRDYGDNI